MMTHGTAPRLEAGGPAVQRRRLAAELRQLREDAGLTNAEVAATLEWSAAKVSRIETARVSVLPRDAKVLINLYGLHDSDERERLIDLARQTRQKPWWHRRGLTVPGWFQQYVGLEAEAAVLCSYHPELIPALLQAPAYREASPAAPGLDAQEAAQLAALLPARQHRLAAAGSPRLHVIVSEAALRRVVGGPSVMAAQLADLAQACDEPNITIQVLPFAAGAHPAMDTPFTLLAFPDPADPGIACPGLFPAACLEDDVAVRRYRHAFNRLHQMALPVQDSRVLITQSASEFARDCLADATAWPNGRPCEVVSLAKAKGGERSSTVPGQLGQGQSQPL
jgi:transcriptional regulator with XRE-family HTH domain